MEIWKRCMLFCAGGCGYMALELLWRGWTHGSMFLAGGLCFTLLGQLDRVRPRLPLFFRAALGAVTITAVELLMGLLVNRSYDVWDYRDMPFHFHGQVCLPFFFLWLPLSLGAMVLYRLAASRLPGKSPCNGGGDLV